VTEAIPSAAPGRAYLAHQREIDDAVHNVLIGGSYILGEQVAAFEREFAAYLGVAQAIGVANGTDALHLALRACGVANGDKVITVSHTAVATVAAIEMAGATPVLVDIDPRTFTMTPSSVEAALQEHADNVTAIIPVHLYGHPVSLSAILEIADRHQLLVIEDCCQSHGAAWQARRTGSFGHMAAFSFYPTKNLGALGDGGAVVTNDARRADLLRMLRQYGWQRRYISEFAGWNSRLDEVQAAILRIKLRYIEADNARRLQIAGVYDEAFAGGPLVVPEAHPDALHVYHQYTVRLKDPLRLQRVMQDAGVGTSILYPQPVHLQPAYRNHVARVDLTQTEKVCREILCLPMYPELTDAEVGRVVEAAG
jgi:dTDP-4-amino-4,6-dideoxygalactose transaminase